MKKEFFIFASTMLLCLSALVPFTSCEREDDPVNISSSSGDNGGGGNGGDNPEPILDGWVDLGLPSGLLWAKCNVGATTPEEYGDYFAWGETTTKSTYNWSTYAYGNDENQLTKYCDFDEMGLNGFTDNLTVLLPEDDAATVILGNGARTPTMEEWGELRSNTTSTWTNHNGVNGRLFTAANGNSIFLPAAGLRDEYGYNGVGDWGGYWSSWLTYRTYQTPYKAQNYIFWSTQHGCHVVGNNRYIGLPVRAVRQN